jgi:hypothetical protein
MHKPLLPLHKFFFLASFELILSVIYLLLSTFNGRWLNSQFFASGLILLISFAFLIGGVVLQNKPRLASSFIRALIANTYIPLISIGFFIFGLIILITPAEFIGGLGGYFGLLSPLVFILSSLPFQWLILSKSFSFFNYALSQRKLLRSAFFIFLAIGAILLVIKITGLGITPDNWWNIAGTPLITWQLLMILFTIVVVVGVGAYLRAKKLLTNGLILDVLVMVSLYVLTLAFWLGAPMTKHYFSLQPSWPAFQPFPISDARVFDLGAISILKGWGINFGSGTQAPLYIIFLAWIRALSGSNYFLSGDIQIAVFALISPVMYLFGKKFHGRVFGLVVPLIFMARQLNAILLSGRITTSNPRVLTSEVFVLFGLLLFSWSAFSWIKRPAGANSSALIAGGLLGAACLIRLNPILLLPTFVVISLFALWKYKRAWLINSVIFVASFLFVLSSWFITGRDAQDRPYLLLKFYDIINTRYDYEINQHRPQDNPLPHFSAGVFRPVASFHRNASYLDISDFPFFVLNHAIHNLLGALLSLPSGFAQTDQVVGNLVERSYLNESQRDNWRGDLSVGQGSTLIFNVFLFSFGVAWSWKKWKWAGLVPLVVFLVYSLSLGLGRTSGGRYLVPIDWVIPFYYSIALVFIINWFRRPLKFKVKKLIEKPVFVSEQKSIFLTSVFLIGLFLLILYSDNWVKPETELCNTQKQAELGEQLRIETVGGDLQFGEALYPYRDEKTFEFMLVTCKGLQSVEIQEFDGRILHGQTVVVLPDRIYQFVGESLNPVWEK